MATPEEAQALINKRGESAIKMLVEASAEEYPVLKELFQRGVFLTNTACKEIAAAHVAALKAREVTTWERAEAIVELYGMVNREAATDLLRLLAAAQQKGIE